MGARWAEWANSPIVDIAVDVLVLVTIGYVLIVLYRLANHGR